MVLADLFERSYLFGELFGVVLGGLYREAYAALVAVNLYDASLDFVADFEVVLNLVDMVFG